MKNAYDEQRRIAPRMLGDYFPLTPYTLKPEDWIAWQFDRPDLKQGVVQVFRRPKAESETFTLKLQELKPEAKYEVENLDTGKETYTGQQLMEGLLITLKEKPQAAILIYKQQ